MPVNSARKISGFTLIEVVVGIVIMAVALTFLSAVFFADPGRSVRPILQIRAAEFGQALMDEILAKPFDESTPLGGVPPCDASCTAREDFGSEGAETRADFDDVDDYHQYCDDDDATQTFALENAMGETLGAAEGFNNYRMRVCIEYDGNYDGSFDTDNNAKLITVEIHLPAAAGLGDPIIFTAYRGNF